MWGQPRGGSIPLARTIFLFWSLDKNEDDGGAEADGANEAGLNDGFSLVAFGVGLAWLLFGELLLFEVALIGAMLAPTDAALGKAVVTNPLVPAKVRESLNVESGLNDGICVPVVLFFIAIGTDAAVADGSAAMAIQLFLQVIGIGLLVGLVLGAQ